MTVVTELQFVCTLDIIAPGHEDFCTDDWEDN